MLGGTFLGNIGSYIYHLLMGRLLTTSDYGMLQSLISLSNIISVPLTTLNTLMVKITSTYLGSQEEGKVAYLHHRLSSLFWRLLLIGGITFLLLKNFIFNLLHIDSFVSLVFLDIAIFFGLLQMLNRSVIQGLARFMYYVAAHLIEAYGKLILGIIAICLGLKAPGAFGAFVLSGTLTYLFTEVILRKILPGKEKQTRVNLGAFGQTTFYSFILTVSIIALFNVDVVLVRHFLSSYESGLYAALSVLGKIIYFGSAPIANTMLPLVTEAYARKQNHHRIFLVSFILAVVVAGLITLIYGLFPDLSLKILIGVQYLEAAQYLFRFGIFLSLCALLNLLGFFFYSVHEHTPLWFLVLAALIQAVGILFHHGSIGEVLTINLTVSASLFIVLLLYYVYVMRTQTAFGHRSRL